MRAASTRINPAHELALLLSGTAAARERHRVRMQELAAHADPVVLEAFLRRASVLALLGPRIEQLAGGRLPQAFHTRLREHHAQAQRQGVGQELLTIRLLAALEEAGIRALPLKGPLLGERLHGDPGARISADVDLLVAHEELRHAEAAVCTLGYRVEPPRGPRDAATPVLHERLVHPDGLPDVELHWRVHWYETRFSAELLAASAPGPSDCLIPRPEHELALLLLLYARDGFAGLRLLCDISAWWDRYGPELPPHVLAEPAAAHPALARSLATATLVAERLAGVPAELILPPPLLAAASPRALRLVNWPLRGAEAQVSANVSLIDWLLAPHGQRWALTRRHLLPSRRELRSRWPGRGVSRGGRAWLRLVHVPRVLSRYAIAAGTLLLRANWAPLPPQPPETRDDR